MDIYLYIYSLCTFKIHGNETTWRSHSNFSVLIEDNDRKCYCFPHIYITEHLYWLIDKAIWNSRKGNILESEDLYLILLPLVCDFVYHLSSLKFDFITYKIAISI